VSAPGVLGNDSDPDDNTLSAVLASGPSHGTLTLNADGSFTYTPTTDYDGTDSFKYRATDGSLTSDSAEVTLTVTASNDSPTVRVAAGGTCGKDDHSGTVNLTVADVESPAAEHTLSAASSNPPLVSTSNVNFAGSGAARTMALRRAQRQRDPDCQRHRWPGQRLGTSYCQGWRRWQGHPDRQQRRQRYRHGDRLHRRRWRHRFGRTPVDTEGSARIELVRNCVGPCIEGERLSACFYAAAHPCHCARLRSSACVRCRRGGCLLTASRLSSSRQCRTRIRPLEERGTPTLASG
jgi:VCBS repeat-containing protein